MELLAQAKQLEQVFEQRKKELHAEEVKQGMLKQQFLQQKEALAQLGFTFNSGAELQSLHDGRKARLEEMIHLHETGQAPTPVAPVAVAPVAVAPAPIAEPQPVAVAPAPIAEPQPVAVAPAPIAEPQPVAVAPAPIAESQPAPVTPAPQPVSVGTAVASPAFPDLFAREEEILKPSDYNIFD